MSVDIVNAFFENCRSRPTTLALSIGDRRSSYGELGDLAEGIRRQLGGVGPGQLVGVAATQDVPTYASLLAALASGRAYVPLNPSAPLSRNEEIIRQTAIDTVITSNVDSALSNACRIRGIRLLDSSRVPSRPLAAPTDVSAETLAYLLFTSGSTGVPKGVPISHRNVEAFKKAMDIEFAGLFNANDRFLQMFELTFDVSVMAFFYPLSVGASVHVVPPRQRRTSFDVLNTVQSANVTVATMVPSALSPLSRYQDELRLPGVRVSILTGEGLPTSLAKMWSRCVPNARQFNLYGPTEATIWSAIYDYTDDLPEPVDDRGIVSIGRPLDGFTFDVVDSADNDVPPGSPGELCLTGDQVADGYWQAPELSARAFRQLSASAAMSYCTGDFVQKAGAHFLYHGRIDEQVQIGGHRVELGEVEFHARQVVPLAAVAAVAISHDGFSQIVLCVESDGIAAIDVRNALRTTLPSHMVPNRIMAFPRFPLNASGKIDKKQLRALAQQSDQA